MSKFRTDLDATDIRQCPYKAYRALRDQSPVVWSSELNAWIITGHEEAKYILAHHTLFSSQNSVFGGYQIDSESFPSMINLDEPKHKELRALVAKAFTPRVVDGLWEKRITERVTELLNIVDNKGTFDAIADLAHPLPLLIIAEMLGVEQSRFDEFARWSRGVARSIGRRGQVGDIKRVSGQSGLFLYFLEAINDRRLHPKDDLLTHLAQAELNGQHLEDPEILSFCILLLVAGNETTTDLIGTAVRVLSEHPELFEKLSVDQKRITDFVEEALRFDAPVQGFYRKATQTVEIAGITVNAGDALLVSFAAANHDPKCFVSPETFDLDRKNTKRHLSFGEGIHYCMGASLGRLETRIAIQELTKRYVSMNLIPNFEPEYRDLIFFHGLKELPLVVVRR